MHITVEGPRLRNDLYCVEWDVELYYTIPCPSVRLSVCHTDTVSIRLNMAHHSSFLSRISIMEFRC